MGDKDATQESHRCNYGSTVQFLPDCLTGASRADEVWQCWMFVLAARRSDDLLVPGQRFNSTHVDRGWLVCRRGQLVDVGQARVKLWPGQYRSLQGQVIVPHRCSCYRLHSEARAVNGGVRTWLKGAVAGMAAILLIASCSSPSPSNIEVDGEDQEGDSTASQLPPSSASVSRESARQDLLDSISDTTPEIEFPAEVPVIQWVTPEERIEYIDVCMTESGFPQGSDGGYHSSADQFAAFEIAWYVCNGSYPLDERYVQPLSEAQIRLVYEYTRDVMIPCYNANGWPVDPSSLPSEDSWVQTWGTTDMWIPPDEPGSMDSDTVNTFGEVCPLMPPSEELYSDEALN